MRLNKNHAVGPGDFSDEHLRPRVLVEEEDDAVRAAIVEMLKDAGFESVGCGGPDTQSSGHCPLENHEECGATTQADVIFCSLRMSDPRNRQILKGLKRLHRNTPIVVRGTKAAGGKPPRITDRHTCRLHPHYQAQPHKGGARRVEGRGSHPGDPSLTS